MTDVLAGNKGGKPWPYLWIFAVAAVAVAAFFLVRLYEREKPQINFTNNIERFGISNDLTFAVTDSGSGIHEINIFLVQGKKHKNIYHKTFPRQGYFAKAGPSRVTESLQVNCKSLGFDDGAAELSVTATDFSFRNWMAGNESNKQYRIVLDTKPPRLTLDEWPRYIKPGGSGVIVFHTNEALTKQGIMINENLYPGFPLGDPADGKFVSMIGIPYDLHQLDKMAAYAVDKAGNRGRRYFSTILRRTPKKTDRIDISDDFLKRKLPELSQYYPKITGSAVQKYIYINKSIRQINYHEIREICSKPHPERLWEGAFKRMAGSRRAGFADYRTYYYHDRKIDAEAHLGMDIASTRHAEVKAANKGKVIFTDYLGIYGNAVIVDHGQGLFSLYGHLSRINVSSGDMVDKDTTLGLTGASGMAGGDHLHFSVIVNGVFVNPLEWWDAKWIKNNITGFF